EPLCRLVDSDDADTRREAIQALASLVQRDLPEEARQYISSVLDKAGIRVSRDAPRRPLDVRPGRPQHAPRHAEPAPRAPSPGPARPASRDQVAPLLNFQKLTPGIELVGRFRVVQRVGGGGFGTVYLVEDTMVREELVLKILSPHLSLDPAMIRRFV